MEMTKKIYLETLKSGLGRFILHYSRVKKIENLISVQGAYSNFYDSIRCFQIFTLIHYCFFGRSWMNLSFYIPKPVIWLKANKTLHLFGKYPNMSHVWVCYLRYNNAYLKICLYLRLHMKIICWRFHSKTPFIFWDMRTWDMWKVCLKTFRNKIICEKLAYVLRNLQTSRGSNSRLFRIKNGEFSGYCFLHEYEHILRFSNLH